MKKYTVYVDDNFHYMDESERYKAGEYKSPKEAVKACRKITEYNLLDLYEEGMTKEELYSKYIMAGEDPWISGTKGKVLFSAWNYAKEQCNKMGKK